MFRAPALAGSPPGRFRQMLSDATRLIDSDAPLFVEALAAVEAHDTAALID